MVPPGLNADGRLNVESLSFDADWYVSHGFLNEKVDLKQVVDHQYVDYAVSTLGEYK